MVNLTELLNQKAELEKQIAEVQRQERTDALTQIRNLMNQYGLSLSDLSGRQTGSRASSKSGGSLAGSKVAAKYRNPVTGDTWSGRGLKPKWLSAALASGKSLSDFAI